MQRNQRDGCEGDGHQNQDVGQWLPFHAHRADLPADFLVSATVQLLGAELLLALAGVALGETSYIAADGFSIESRRGVTTAIDSNSEWGTWRRIADPSRSPARHLVAQLVSAWWRCEDCDDSGTAHLDRLVTINPATSPRGVPTRRRAALHDDRLADTRAPSAAEPLQSAIRARGARKQAPVKLRTGKCPGSAEGSAPGRLSRGRRRWRSRLLRRQYRSRPIRELHVRLTGHHVL